MVVAVHDVVPGAAVHQRHRRPWYQRLERRPRDHHPDDAADGRARTGATDPDPARHPALGAYSSTDLARVLLAEGSSIVPRSADAGEPGQSDRVLMTVLR